MKISHSPDADVAVGIELQHNQSDTLTA